MQVQKAVPSVGGLYTKQAVFVVIRAFVARWYAYVIQLHTLLEVELDHGRGGARSRPRGLDGPAVCHLKAQELWSTYVYRADGQHCMY